MIAMAWYAIQTYTGKEEQLVEMIYRMLPAGIFSECFVPYFERLRRWHHQNQICILRLFPGYIFISTEDINSVFGLFKKIPAMSKIMSTDDFEFTSIYEEEARFLLEILDSDHIVRLTYVATDGKGSATYMAGPLKECSGRIQAYKFRDRYAQVRLTIAGHEKSVRMGLILDNDVRAETGYGKVEAHIIRPEVYVPIKRDPAASVVLVPGDRVAVVGGAFEGNAAVVRKVKSGIVSITVRMFGREIPLELSSDEVRKIETE